MTKNLNLGQRRRERPLISLYKKVNVADMALDKKKCGFGKELAAPNLFKKNTKNTPLNILFQFLHQIYGEIFIRKSVN